MNTLDIHKPARAAESVLIRASSKVFLSQAGNGDLREVAFPASASILSLAVSGICTNQPAGHERVECPEVLVVTISWRLPKF